MGGGLDALKLVNSPEGKRRGLGYRQAEYIVDQVRKGQSDMDRSIFGENPYTGDSAQTQPPPPTYNEDQMKWAQKFNAPVPIGAPPNAFIARPESTAADATPATSAMIQKGLNLTKPLYSPQGNISAPRQPVPATPAPKPFNMSRAALIQGARDSGDFEKVRENYNASHARAGTGLQMDKNGTIQTLSKTDDGTGTSPYARATLGAGAQDIAARRDFERGEAPVQFTSPTGNNVSGGFADQASMAPYTRHAPGTVAIKQNPYGTATATFGLPTNGGGMMPNPLRPGETIPTKQWMADQSDVQDTKYGPNAAQAGADYLNPKALAKSMTPVAQPAAKKSAIASVPNPYSPPATSVTPPDSGTIKGLPAPFVPPQEKAFSRITTVPSGPTSMPSQRGLDTIKLGKFGDKPLGAASAKRFQSIARGGSI